MYKESQTYKLSGTQYLKYLLFTVEMKCVCTLLHNTVSHGSQPVCLSGVESRHPIQYYKTRQEERNNTGRSFFT